METGLTTEEPNLDLIRGIIKSKALQAMEECRAAAAAEVSPPKPEAPPPTSSAQSEGPCGATPAAGAVYTAEEVDDMFTEMRKQMALDFAAQAAAARGPASSAQGPSGPAAPGPRGHTYAQPPPKTPYPTGSSLPRVQMPRDIPMFKAQPSPSP